MYDRYRKLKNINHVIVPRCEETRLEEGSLVCLVDLAGYRPLLKQGDTKESAASRERKRRAFTKLYSNLRSRRREAYELT
jgi:hypothetical protein